MAKLPTLDALGERPNLRTSRSVVSYHPVSGKETAPGEAMAKAGSEINEAAAMLFKKKDQDDVLRAEDAFTKLRTAQAELTLGEDGFVQKKSGDAANQPIGKIYNERFDSHVKDIEGTLANDNQRRLFKSRADVARLQFGNDIANHVNHQRDVYAHQVLEGGIATEVQSASTRWQDPNAIGLSIERIQGLIDQEADRAGWPEDKRKAAKVTAQSKTHEAVIDQALANNNLGYAKQWYSAHKDVIDPAVSVRIDHAIDQHIAKYERQVAKQLNQVESVVLAGFDPTPVQLNAVVTAAKGTSLEGEAAQLVQTAKATSQFRLMPPAQQAAYLTRLEAEIRKDPSKHDLTLIGKFRTIHESQEKALKESPVSYAVKQGLIATDDPAAQPLDLSKPDQIGPQLTARFELSRAMSARYGTPDKPLTTEEAGLLSNALKNTPTAQKRDYFGNLYKASGNDFQGYSAMLAQIAPDDPVAAVAGVYAGRGMTSTEGRVVSDYILRGQSILHPDKKADGTPSGGKVFPMPKEKDLQDGFVGYERDAFAGKEGARNAYLQTAKAIYAAKSVEVGDYSGEIDKSRWESSISMATGGIETYKGKSIIMPYGLNYSDFKDSLHRRIDVIEQSGRLPEGVKGSKLKDLPLESIGDGKYLFRAGDSILVDKDKKAIIVDFNQQVYTPPKKSWGGAYTDALMNPRPGDGAIGMPK